MKRLPIVVALVGLMSAGPLAVFLTTDEAAAAEPSWSALESQFHQLPADARRLTGPLFWLHGDESRERLEMYVQKMAEGGNGCFTAESRPHRDWLGETWFRDLAICLDAAKRHGLKMWIFDEKWWPSGEVGGKVPERYGSKRLEATAIAVTGLSQVGGSGFGGANYIAAVAGSVGRDGIDPTSLVDLAPFIRDGSLKWQAPAGEWKVMKFTWKSRKSGNRYLLDGASRESVDWYIRTVYQPHYDRFKDEFGRNILGFFYDEPETHGDWGTEVRPILAERKVDWKAAFVAWKFQLGAGMQAAARYQYQEALAEAWGRTLYGGLTRWCKAHGVQSIGHWLEHSNCYVHPDLCAGNMFPLQKYSSMGGIDAVFTQFKMGQRVAQDAPCWQTPKLGSSITHAYGKADDVTMVEIFGARGQDVTYPEMKWWTDHMHVSGVNFHIPHSFNPRAPRDTDCPPYFYNGGFEPRWPLYRVYADYTARLSLLLSGGRHVAPVALLYLGGSAHVGKHILPDGMSEALQDALYDCDWLPYEVFEKDMAVDGEHLRLRSEAYKILVVPAVEVIPYATLAKARDFFEQGGVVVGYGFLPSKSATLGWSELDITRLCDKIWGAPQPGPGLRACKTNRAGGRSYLLPERPTPEQLQQVLAGDAGIHPTLEVVEGRTDHWLHVLHRVKSGRDVFFITNQIAAGPPRKFRFRITAAGVPECWDALRDEIRSIQYRRDGATVELSLTMEPNESVVLAFAPEARKLPPRVEPGQRTPRVVAELVRVASPPQREPKLELGGPTIAQRLDGCTWVWYPEGDPAAGAPPGTRCFRKQLSIPEGRKIAKATFVGTADNGFTLYVNGREAGHGDDSPEGWRNPAELDVTALMRPGVNQLAIQAVNGGEGLNPAGLIGRLIVQLDGGASVSLTVDNTWKTANKPAAGWTAATFDDSAWQAAKETVAFGGGPWGRLGGGNLTLSPVKADPMDAHCQLPAGALAGPQPGPQPGPIYLEMDSLAPETAARVTVNGQYAGGLIGKPLRLDVTRHLRPGENRFRIEPFAPKQARLVGYEKE